MKLYELVPEKSGWHIQGNTSIEILTIVSDSRAVRPGALFVAVRGLLADGHSFIEQAIAAGAVAIVAEEPLSGHENLSWIQVDNSRRALGLMSSAFYGHPSGKLKLVGVTGTNGKTTTVTMLARLFTELGYKTGLISTVVNRYPGFEDASTHTTPDPVVLNRLLRDMLDAGCSHVFMEVSSHAVDQDRIAGLEFEGAVFTNISRDHLDYHKTFKAYIGAKKKFFDELHARAFALVNADDPNGAVMVQNTAARVSDYALRRPADFHAKILEESMDGLHILMDGQDFHAGLIGRFNAYNLLAVYSTAVLLGEERLEVLTKLSAVPPAPGRFEVLREAGGLVGIVDYAHTPDALEQVLKTILKTKAEGVQLIAVVGCGGDRDKGKRAAMAAIAAGACDKVIFTSDNPRSESPDAIIDEMMLGVDAKLMKKVFRVTDRREAIRMACALANSGDVVLVAGKGHEKYQEIKGVKYPFDDVEELKAAMLKDI